MIRWFVLIYVWVTCCNLSTATRLTVSDQISEGNSVADSKQRALQQQDYIMGSPLHDDLKVLLSVKDYLIGNSPSSNSSLLGWDGAAITPCPWNGIRCMTILGVERVIGVDLTSANLNGPIPSSLANLTALIFLSLKLNKLNGSIPSELGDLTQLAELDLSSNFLSGTIPSSIGRLSNLETLNLAYNSLDGGIPAAFFSNCSSLKSLNISNNPKLGGEFPTELTNCRSLNLVDLEGIGLSGDLPYQLGQIPTLQHLNLGSNNLTGTIPAGIFDSCRDLQYLDLSQNNLRGGVPAEIGNCTGLTTLMLCQNYLTSIPLEIGKLTSLKWLFLGSNKMSGPLPTQISLLTNLIMLDLRYNSFSGEIPKSFSELKAIQYLALNINSFTGNLPPEIAVLPNLTHLDASDNQLSGYIPSFLANISSLKFLLLANNSYTGSIPPEIGYLSNLQLLDLGENQLTGAVPDTIGNLQSLLWLRLSSNSLSGSIPRTIGNCTSLIWLNLFNNSLSGSLPDSMSSMSIDASSTFSMNARTLRPLPRQLGECHIVMKWLPNLDYPFNTVPPVLSRDRCQIFWNLLMNGASEAPLCKARPDRPSNGYIQVSMNKLSGSIPSSLGNNPNMGMIFLSHNNLSGSIPVEMNRPEFELLNFSHNSLSGPLPSSYDQMVCLTMLDLSYNNLSGLIPPSLQSCSALAIFNISYNPDISGLIPTSGQFSTFGIYSYLGDNQLCYPSTVGPRNNASEDKIPLCSELRTSLDQPRRGAGVATLSTSTIVVISLACCLGVIIIGVAGFCLMGRETSSEAAAKSFMMVGKEGNRLADTSVQVSLFSVDLPKQLTYSDLLQATDNFSEANVAGSGGYGVVYKAKLKDGTLVAIKKLIQEGLQADREFLAEMETLGHVHHENLVPLLGCSAYGTEKLLVYKYMENGSLDDWLHEKLEGAEALEWPLRLNIALGMARGLKFLHHNCSPPIIHRDMKASNILLNENFEARLTDFGLARVLGAQETHVSTVVAGTLGYVPPEYCHTWRATIKGDVYSFGVVLLELITGRRPTDISFDHSNCGNVVDWVALQSKRGAQRQVCHPIVLQTAATAELLQFLKLAMWCTADLPIKRPTMREALKALEEIKSGNYAASHVGCSMKFFHGTLSLNDIEILAEKMKPFHEAIAMAGFMNKDSKC